MPYKTIMNPRPLYEPEKPLKNREVISVGKKDSGIEITVTKKGLEITGYYKGFSSTSPIYGILSKPVKISWKELEKIKDKLVNKKERATTPYKIEDELDEDYLNSLPKVHINDELYYIDSKRKERRSVRNPNNVFKY